MVGGAAALACARAQALDALTQRFGTAPIAQDDDWAQMVVIPVPGRDADAPAPSPL